MTGGYPGHNKSQSLCQPGILTPVKNLFFLIEFSQNCDVVGKICTVQNKPFHREIRLSSKTGDMTSLKKAQIKKKIVLNEF